MIKINLLPWRETQRKRKQQQFIIALSLSLIFVLSVFAYLHSYILNQQAYQIQRNRLLQQEVTLQDQNVLTRKMIEEKINQFINKINYINTLQTSRLDTRNVLQQLTFALPSTLFLTKITRIDHEIIIEGRAQSSGALSVFMQKMGNETSFQTPVLETMKLPDSAGLESIKNSEEMPLFVLHTQQRNLH